ncbi:NUDIX domain-containing protein [Plantactinospora sp. GCM10030261]|uniref:NUDIX hydrolase n=1 Tax=Plantactinospora sp. GCM10030261 TaxID=3273420 RepID=UPI0036110196
MAIPEYIRWLRKQVGTDLLWLPSVSAVVLNDAGAVLLGKRSDDGRWSVISGFVEPDEQPAAAVVREVEEETGVIVTPERITSVWAHPHVYPNGDRCQYLNIGFRCRPVRGEARVNDDESTEVRWFSPDDLPPLDEHATLTIERARADVPETWFVPPA